MRAMEYTQVQCQCEPMGQWTLVRWCPIHSKRIEPTKKLTDAECAAEYWRAKADLATIEAVLVSPAAMNARVRVWHRFVTCPHASEVDQ